MWEPLYDLWSWCFFKFSEWRWSERGEGSMLKRVWWLLIPLILLLARRFYSRNRVRRLKTDGEETSGGEGRAGCDSEFYLVEKRLIESGYTRYPYETLSGWIGRIEDSQPSSVSTVPLRPILALHYRYRFDPMGISGDERAALKSTVHSWLEQAPIQQLEVL